MTDAIQLVIADQGVGFDVEEAKKSGGLGLMSMQERMHLVNGKLSVESKPGQGTRILAIVPLLATRPGSPVSEGNSQIAV